MTDFDDARLEDRDLLRRADPLLRPLAEAGARLRREFAAAQGALAGLTPMRPRSVIVTGPEARLMRAVLEPTCPVPFVAWPSLVLPGWVGPLDIVVVLGGSGRDSHQEFYEAVRRGAQVLVSAPPESTLARQFASRTTTILPAHTGDPVAAAVIALAGLHELGIGGYVNAEAIAGAMDAVAEECSYLADATTNPGKAMALDLADSQPLVWGNSILASRASRRIASALRTASGRLGLAADAAELLPILDSTMPRDPFADPIEHGTSIRPALVLLDDGTADPAAMQDRESLLDAATRADVRITRVSHHEGSALERYVTLLQRGLFAAAYLQIGLGRSLP